MKKEKSAKCELCEYSDISTIQLYDCAVQCCSKCGIVRVSVQEYMTLMYKVIHSLDIGNIKSYHYANEFTKDTVKSLKKCIKVCDLDSFKLIDVESGKCNVCRSNISEFVNRYYKDFKIYYCLECNSVYFDKKKLDDFAKFIDKVSKPFSFIDFLKEIFSFSKVKDNAKEQTIQSKLLHKEDS